MALFVTDNLRTHRRLRLVSPPHLYYIFTLIYDINVVLLYIISMMLCNYFVSPPPPLGQAADSAGSII